MKCCGEQCYTRFCPTCGAKTGNSDLPALLKYLRAHQKASEVFMKNQERRVTESPDNQRLIMSMKSKSLRASKWKSWADEVERLMQLNENHTA